MDIAADTRADGSQQVDLRGVVDRLLDRGGSEREIASHCLEQLTACRLRERELPVPFWLRAAERAAALAAMTAPIVLARVRSACDGPLVLMKGPQVAAAYASPLHRVFWDIDLLVSDAEAVQEQLRSAGFQPVGDPTPYAGIHHLPPLGLPGLPIAVEIHSRPKWVDGLPAPEPRALLENVVPAAVGVAGIDALPPAEHAVVLAAHAWAHEPLRRLRDLLDIGLVAAACEPGEIESLAAAWRVRRLWRVTEATVEAVLSGTRLPRSVRVWGRGLESGRERTVLENHLMRWLSGFAVLPPSAALRGLGPTIRRELMPWNEPWRAKVARVRHAVRRAFHSRSEHVDRLGLREGR